MKITKSGGRLREKLLGSQVAYVAVNLALFAFAALITVLVSNALGAEGWFSTAMGIAVGVLTYLCVRTWLDEDELDNPDTKLYVVLAGVLGFLCMMMAYITLHIFPFGDHTVLIIDMHHQYVAFFSLLREKITTLGNPFYSDSLGLGGGFIPLVAYYLCSPFNLLLLVFPRANLTDALTFITLLKIAAAGVTFAIFAKRFFRRNDFSVTVGGLAYSTMAFLVAHSWNLMWLDPIILLPLIVLGLDKLLHEGKPLLYCVTLAMALITNYYIGYMICIFLVFYYIMNAVADGRPHTTGERAQRFWRFCYGSLLGGGIAAVMILPAFIYLQSTSGADDAFARQVTSNFPLFSLFERLLFGAYPSMRGDNLPNVYCSVLAVFLLVLFVTCKNISLRKRVAWSALVGVVAIAMSINWTNFAWHGFHFPNDLPYRFSFLMSFAMLVVAMHLFSELEHITPSNVLTAFAVCAALLVAEQYWGEATFRMIYVSLAFVIVYAIIFSLHSAGMMKRSLCCAFVLLFLFVEVAADNSLLLTQLDQNEYYTERNDFNYDYEVDSKAIAAVEKYEDNMYRTDLLPRKTCNDPSLFGYSGLTVFASSNTEAVTTVMGRLGYAINGVNSYLYQNFVPVADSLLGLKYVILSTELGEHEQLIPLGSVNDEIEVNYRYIYQNSMALSKAYYVSYAVRNWDWNNSNPFHVQNNFITNATGFDNVYKMIDIFASSGGANGENTPTATVSGFNSIVDVSGSYFSCTQDNEGLDGSFTVTQPINEDGQYYVYLDCRAAESMSVHSGSVSSSSNPTEPSIIDLGYLYAGADVEITVNSKMTCCGNIFLAKLDKEACDMAFEKLAQSQLEADSCKEGHIKGSITAPTDGLVFTSIPYDKGWTVKVDGRKVETEKIGDALMAFEIPAGTHTVQMDYFPSGLLIGLLISLLCIFILVVLCNKKLRAKAEELLMPILPKHPAAVTAGDTDDGFYGDYESDYFDDGFEDIEDEIENDSDVSEEE